MLSWSWRSIKLLLLHLVGVPYLLYLHWWCTVKHKSSLFLRIYNVCRLSPFLLQVHRFWNKINTTYVGNMKEKRKNFRKSSIPLQSHSLRKKPERIISKVNCKFPWRITSYVKKKIKRKYLFSGVWLHWTQFAWLLSLAIHEHEIGITLLEFTFVFMEQHNHPKVTHSQLYAAETVLSVSNYT
jgi:hypothetical protein